MIIDMGTPLPGPASDAADSKQAPKDPWTENATVFEAVFNKVNRAVAFQQREFTRMREQIVVQMEEKAEEERKSQAAAAEASSVKELDSQANVSAEDLRSEKSKKTSRPPTILVESQEGEAPEALATINSSRKLLSEHGHSVGGTSKSIGRSTKFMQRVQELSDRQKISKWEEMLSDYYKEGMQEFYAMRSLRQRVCRSLNETQRKFIDYLSRHSDQQRKVNDYCENYNRFSREFPDLIGNLETKKELLNRVDILSK